ncbi:MAG: DNA translocase FtsK [Pelotomaculum sp. PtaB.Bin104]|nr:MAG: DNA translocase FtsK [Pelotomaculum sp. PtaB.Bin104]
MSHQNPVDTWVSLLVKTYKTFQPKKTTLNDIWTNCGLVVRRNKEKPLLPVKLSERKRPYGRDLLLHIPVGLSDLDFYRRYEKLCWAFNAEIELEPVNGKLLIRIMDQQLQKVIPFDLPQPPTMALPVPVGYSRAGLEWLDLAAAPHFLVAGTPGSGKSNLLHCLCAALYGIADIRIIDLKRLEFSYLRQHGVTVAATEKEAARVLLDLNHEMDRRLAVLEAAGVVKVQDYDGNMPFIVCIIDELAELQDDTCHSLLNRLLRLARACGISIVAATQRPSTAIISGDSRAQFAARLCYRVADEVNSRMVLGETCSRAAYLPTVPGRAILRWDKTREVQTMFLPVAEARKRLYERCPSPPEAPGIA